MRAAIQKSVQHNRLIPGVEIVACSRSLGFLLSNITARIPLQSWKSLWAISMTASPREKRLGAPAPVRKNRAFRPDFLTNFPFDNEVGQSDAGRADRGVNAEQRAEEGPRVDPATGIAEEGCNRHRQHQDDPHPGQMPQKTRAFHAEQEKLYAKHHKKGQD